MVGTGEVGLLLAFVKRFGLNPGISFDVEQSGSRTTDVMRKRHLRDLHTSRTPFQIFFSC